jgi:hypothetical protein
MFTCDNGCSIRLVESGISVICLLSLITIGLISFEGSIEGVTFSVGKKIGGGLIIELVSFAEEFVPNIGNDDVRIFKLTFYKINQNSLDV